jgi:uncharacterized membrane protein
MVLINIIQKYIIYINAQFKVPRGTKERKNKVINFLKNHSYSAVRLFVTQIVISVFGLALVIATGQNHTLQIIVSCAAVAFYLFLIYAAMWDIGSKDCINIETGKVEKRPLTGLFISLFANIPNFILAILITIGMLFADGGAISKLGATTSSIALWVQGMYVGLMTIDVGGAPLNSYFWMYFVIIIPAVGIATLAYFLGSKGIHATRILIADTPEEAEIKREKKRARKKKRDEEN